MRYYSSIATEKSLTTGINASAVEITLDSITNLPVSFPYTLVLGPDTATEEIVTVTSLKSGTTLYVTRAQDGSSAASHVAGEKVKHMVTARDLQEPQNHIAATSAVHGIASGFVGLTDAQTLTNKTINLANNSLTGTVAQFNAALSGADFVPTTGATMTGPIDFGTLATAITANGLSLSATEVGYLDGVTSNIQTQMNALIGGSAGRAATVYANTVTTSLSSANTWYPVALDTEVLDTVGWWSSGNNTRITPTVAGYYLVVGSVYGLASNTGVSRYAAVRKNGSTMVIGSAFRHTEPSGGFQGAALNIPTNPVLVQMNGTTDYLELMAKSDQASQLTAQATASEGQACVITVIKVA